MIFQCYLNRALLKVIIGRNISSKIILTDTYFSLVQDNKEVIEKWINFKTIKIEDTHIVLVSDQENYVFPNKSMEASDYNSFKDFITLKIKENHTISPDSPSPKQH